MQCIGDWNATYYTLMFGVEKIWNFECFHMAQFHKSRIHSHALI